MLVSSHLAKKPLMGLGCKDENYPCIILELRGVPFSFIQNLSGSVVQFSAMFLKRAKLKKHPKPYILDKSHNQIELYSVIKREKYILQMTDITN